MKITLNEKDYEKLIKGEVKYILHFGEIKVNCEIWVGEKFRAIVRSKVDALSISLKQFKLISFNLPLAETIEIKEQKEDSWSWFSYTKIEKLGIINIYEEITLGE